jgi:two-component system CheB/CheR fusion protein
LVDACLPGISGLQLIQRLREKGYSLPAIMMTGNGDVPMAVRAMQTGACDFLEKPVDGSELLSSIQRALEQSRDSQKRNRWRAVTLSRLERLTSREREIMQKVLAGEPSKNIAADFGLSQRTVENHRAAIMKKTGCKSIPALARLVIAANGLDQANIPDAKASLAEFVS